MRGMEGEKRVGGGSEVGRREEGRRKRKDHND